MRQGFLEWINQYLGRYTGAQARPVQFDVGEVYPTLLELRRNCAVIRRELEAVLPYKESIPRYHEVDANQRYISAEVDPDKSWRTFMLYSVGERNDRYAARCPQTAALLAQIPNLVNAFFSILDPGKSIPTHSGPYCGVLRYHLGLIVPQSNPPYMRVRDQFHTWREGEDYLFDDSWDHEVVNHSDAIRVVLAVDVLRPLPALPHFFNYLAVGWIGRSAFAREVNQSIRAAAEKLPSQDRAGHA